MAARRRPVRQGPARPARAGRTATSSFKPGSQPRPCCSSTSTRRTTRMSLQRGLELQAAEEAGRAAGVHRAPAAHARRRDVPRRHRRAERRRRQDRRHAAHRRCGRPRSRSSSGTPFPPIVVFSWGDVEAVRRRRQVGDVDAARCSGRTGQPVRATCKVSMQEFDPSPPRPEPDVGRAAKRPAPTRSCSATRWPRSPTPSTATPTLWRAIAIANGLEDPFNLRVGAELLHPRAGRRRGAGLRPMAAQRVVRTPSRSRSTARRCPTTVAAALLEAYVEDEVNLPDAFELVFRDPLRTVLARRPASRSARS